MALGVMAFLALALYQLELPGLHYDEAKEAGVPAMQLLLGKPVDAFRGAGLRLGSRLLPWMVQDYIGALQVYLCLPFLALFGVNVFALRLMPVFVASLTVLFTALLARELYGEKAALIACLLLAVNPSFVFWSRQGVFVTSVTSAIAVAGLLAWLRWYRGRRPFYLYLGAFLLGLGLWAKLLFVWVVVGAGLAFLLLACPWKALARRTRGAMGKGHEGNSPHHGIPVALYASLRPLFSSPHPRQALAALFSFFLPLVPLCLFNLQTGGTWVALLGNLTRSYYGVNNLAFWPNLSLRLTQFRSLLEGSHLWYLGGIFANRLYPFLLGFCFVGLLPCAFFGAGRGRARKALFPFLLLLFVLLQSCFTVSALWVTHYAVILPFIPLAVAASADFVLRRSAGWGRALTLMALVALLLGELRVDIRYHRALAASGGHSTHSDAVYALASYLDEGGLSSPLAMDWGIAAPVQFLTEGRVNPIEVFGYQWEADEGFGRRLEPFLESPDSIYIFHGPEETVFRRWEAFEEAVRGKGGRIVEEKTFHERGGRPVFVLVRVYRE